jgi:hypothetical protein
MGRGILTIFIVVSGILSILSAVMLTHVISKDMTDLDIKGLKIFNITNDEKATGSNAIAQHTPSSPLSEENENIGIIAALPNKCQGSALCPD